MGNLSINFDFNPILSNSSSISSHALCEDRQHIISPQSLWKRFSQFRKVTELDEQLNQKVLGFFQNRYNFTDQTSFKRIWNKIAATTWSTTLPLTAGTIRAIDQKFKEMLIYHGEGIAKPATIKKAETLVYETDAHLEELRTATSEDGVKKIVGVLLHGSNFSHSMVAQDTARAIFLTHNEIFMGYLQKALQSEMDNLHNHPPKTPQEEIIWRAFLGNIIALLPFSYPSQEITFKIPCFENGLSRQIDYSVEVLPLLYSNLSSPMTALGLTPKEDPSASPILSFIGTTFPAGSGFSATLLADFTPGHSVGEIIYKLNKDSIQEWLKNKNDVHVIGMSLGGAMAFHALRNNQEKFSRLDVYNPPGLYSGNWEIGIGTTCEVNIYCQPGDVVSKLGFWPIGDNVSLYTVFQHQEGISEDAFSSHARSFLGCKNITVVKEDIDIENRAISRHILTRIHQLVGPFLVFLPVTCTLLLYKAVNSVHRASTFCFTKIKEALRPTG